MDRFSTDTDELHAVANLVAAGGDEIGGLPASAAAALRTAADSIGDPGVAGSLHQLAAAWRSDLAGLAELGSGLGSRVGLAAQTYDAGESGAATAMRRP